MQCFRFGVTSCLVTTAIGARGLNFPDVQHVVNYDVPASVRTRVVGVQEVGQGAWQRVVGVAGCSPLSAR